MKCDKKEAITRKDKTLLQVNSEDDHTCDKCNHGIKEVIIFLFGKNNNPVLLYF